MIDRRVSALTGSGNFFEDFPVGRRLRHARGATVGDVENNLVTKQVMNTAQGHWNEHAMAGSPMGDGRLVFGLVTGLPRVRPRQPGHRRERPRRAGLHRAALQGAGAPRRHLVRLHRGAGGRPVAGSRGRRRGAVQALGRHPRRSTRLRRRAHRARQATQPLGPRRTHDHIRGAGGALPGRSRVPLRRPLLDRAASPSPSTVSRRRSRVVDGEPTAGPVGRSRRDRPRRRRHPLGHRSRVPSRPGSTTTSASPRHSGWSARGRTSRSGSTTRPSCAPSSCSGPRCHRCPSLAAASTSTARSAATCTSISTGRTTASTSRKRAPASRCSCSTPPARTACSTATSSRTSASPTTSASSRTTSRSTASRCRPAARRGGPSATASRRPPP